MPTWSPRFDGSGVVGSPPAFSLHIAAPPGGCVQAITYSSEFGLQTVAALLGRPLPPTRLLGIALDEAQARFGAPVQTHDRSAVWTGVDPSGASVGALELTLSELDRVVEVAFTSAGRSDAPGCVVPASVGQAAPLPGLPMPEALGYLLAPDGGLHVLTGEMVNPQVISGMTVTMSLPQLGDAPSGWTASFQYLEPPDVAPQYTWVTAGGATVLSGERIAVLPEGREADLLRPPAALVATEEGPEAIGVVLRGSWPEASPISSADVPGVRIPMATRLEADPRQLHIHVLGETGWTFVAVRDREARAAWLMSNKESIPLPVEYAHCGYRVHLTAFRWEGRDFVAFPAPVGVGGYVEVGEPAFMPLPRIP